MSIIAASSGAVQWNAAATGSEHETRLELGE